MKYSLENTNLEHFPSMWKVVERENGRFTSRKQAVREAKRLNELSQIRWHKHVERNFKP